MKQTIKSPWTAKLIKAITKLVHRVRAKTILLRFGYGQRKKKISLILHVHVKSIVIYR